MHQRDRTDDKWIRSQQKLKDKMFIDKVKYRQRMLKSFAGYNKHGRLKQEPKEPTGEKELFIEIWETSDKRSWLTGDDLNKWGYKSVRLADPPELPKRHPLFYNMFHHVLNTKIYSRYKLNKDNIVLLTPQEHMSIHSEGRKMLEDKYGKENIDRYFNLFENLRQEYNET